MVVDNENGYIFVQVEGSLSTGGQVQLYPAFVSDHSQLLLFSSGVWVWMAPTEPSS